MSDFGSTLRSIIKVFGVKSYILADALGYDPSYLSKWLNNSKRPPAAMIDGIAEEIAKVCVHSGDTSAFEKLAENYNIQSVDVSDKTACKKMIKSIIANSFFETERETQPRKKAALPVTCPLNIDLVFEQLMVHIERGADKFDLIIPLNVFKLAVEKKPELLAFFKIGSTERQRVSLRLFYTDSTLEEDDSMEVFILSLAHVFFNSSFQLYYISQADYSKYGGLCVLNDCFAVCGIRDPFSGEALCASISNHESVEKIYHSALSYFYKQTSVFDHAKPYSEKAKKYSYKYATNPSHVYILGEMFPIYMDSEIQKLVFNTQLSPTSADSNKNFYYEYAGTTSVYIFESVFLNYFVDGSMCINNTRHIVLGREERKHHIETLLQRMKECSGLDIYIVRDINPVLKANDCRFSIFSAADVCLVINCCEESEEREAYYITSDKGCAVVERLIAKFKALPDDILLSKERSMEYIQKSLRII